MKAEKLKEALPTEAALCEHFIKEFNAQPGWTCYPETGGYDILVVHESGRQIGVEAKLQLNAKVADQILPCHSWHCSGNPGPDHRIVIVRSITDANAGIAKMLEFLGVHVWQPWIGENLRRNPNTGDYETVPDVQFSIRSKLWEDERCAEPARHVGRYKAALYDWSPSERIALPNAVPDLPAGVPAPVRMTPWKQAAVRVVALLRHQGYITSKQIAAEGCSPSVWTQKWLDRSETRGQWVESDRMPPIDKQHPEMYSTALADLAEHEKEAECSAKSP